MWRSPRRGAREFLGAQRCNASELWSALLRRVLETRLRSSAASSPAGAPATWPTEATVRLTGAHVALGAASVLVIMLFPAAEELHHGVLAVHAVVLLGCAAVLLSPVAELARGAAVAVGKSFGAPAAPVIWSAPARVMETWFCSSAPTPAGGRTMSLQAEAAVRWTGALMALAAASALVLVPFTPAVEELNHGGVLLVLYGIFLLGCAAVVLSPAHRAVADLARRGTDQVDARKIFRRPNTGLRWAGFTCIMLYAVSDVRPEATAAKEEVVVGLVLFLLFLVGVWTVSLSMVTGEEHQGGEVDGTAALAARDDDVSKV